MQGSSLDTHGTAYLCYLDGRSEFVGSFLSDNGIQYRLQGFLHDCSNHDARIDYEDHHTCCFDDSWKEIDLSITPLNDDPPVDHFENQPLVIHHVMKYDEDNFSLVSQHVQFFTDDLLVDADADTFIKKYVSPDLIGKGKGFLVCVGKIIIRHPEPIEKKNNSNI